jgi:hypothetical protein
VFDGVLERQNATLALRLIPDIAVFLVHANHDSRHLWATHNGWKDCTRGVITCEASLAHTTAVVYDKGCNLIVG